MKKIVFDEGYRTYQVGDSDRVIKVRLDPDLMKRLRDAEDAISGMSERLENASADELTEISNEIKGIFNDAFGTDVCTPAFDGANIFTLVDEDKMLFQSFFEAFIPILKEDIEALTNKNKQPRPEVQAYLKKESSMPDLSKLPPEKLALLEQFLA